LAIPIAGVKRIVTADPHAYKALKNDYSGVVPVQHISQVVARKVVNIEDAIKVAGIEGQMEAIDLVEITAQQLS
jgi:Fe-S oxidoreductase